MVRIALFMLPIVLCSCASQPNYSSLAPSTGTIAWDGLGDHPKQPRRIVKLGSIPPVEADANRERREVLASLKPYSAAWWKVNNEIEADYDKQLTKKLLICQQCLPRPPSGDLTASVRVTDR